MVREGGEPERREGEDGSREKPENIDDFWDSVGTKYPEAGEPTERTENAGTKNSENTSKDDGAKENRESTDRPSGSKLGRVDQSETADPSSDKRGDPKNQGEPAKEVIDEERLEKSTNSASASQERSSELERFREEIKDKYPEEPDEEGNPAKRSDDVHPEQPGGSENEDRAPGIKDTGQEEKPVKDSDERSDSAKIASADQSDEGANEKQKHQEAGKLEADQSDYARMAEDTEVDDPKAAGRVDLGH